MPMDGNVRQEGRVPESGPTVGRPTFRSYADGDETEITRILNACHAQAWGSERLWRWKHSRRPNFSADDVTLAVVGGQVVGCFHSAVLPLRLEEGLEVPMCFEGDFAVLPEYRKAGLPLQAHDRASRRLLDAGVILRGGFTSRELNERFYHRQFGYVFVPTVTTEFRKIIGLKPLQQKVAHLSEQLCKKERFRHMLRGIRLVMNLTIDRLPPSRLDISEHQIALREGFAPDAHMKLHIPYAVLAVSKKGLRRTFQALLSQAIRGRVRLEGFWPNMGQLIMVVCRFLVKPVKA